MIPRVRLRASTDIGRRVTWRRALCNRPGHMYVRRDRRRNALSNRSSLFIGRKHGARGPAATRRWDASINDACRYPQI